MSIIKQGEKLLLLVRRDSRTTEEVAKAMNMDKSYLPRLYKKDILPPKPFQRALEVFGVPAAYFLEGGAEPIGVGEPDTPYERTEDNTLLAALQADNTALRDEIRRLTTRLEQEMTIKADLAEALKNLSKRE